ncbi:MAG: FtsX-like permease family protein [Hespellia sp.]|nr:FtsX-like permease family protein [Hespellia sp.]
MGQFIEYVKMALDNIRANKGRSLLTMLGIIIGITSVVTIVSIGNGLKEDVINASNEQNNQLTIMANSDEITDPYIITGEDIQNLEISLEDSISGISAAQSSYGNVETRKGKYEALITFSTSGYEFAQYMTSLVSGSYFTDNDVANGNMVCVLDELTAIYLFGNTNVLGMDLDLNIDNNIQTLNIIGIRETTEEVFAAEKTYLAMGMEESLRIEVPYTTVTAFGGKIDGFSSIDITAKNKEDVSMIAQNTIRMLNAQHRSLGDNLFIQQKPIDLSDMFGPIMDGVTAFVALVAAISLIVGGIGVMNIMLVSVTERTREIGIRKALGAKTGSIITQFLCESAIISGVGGVIGILLGAGLTALISALEIGGIHAHLSFPAVLVATLFSCSVGIVFGIYPARKAAKLNPIDALRGI